MTTKKRLHTDATVHEKTVQKAAASIEETRLPRRRRNQSTGSSQGRDGEVIHLKVMPEVWAKAMELCGGDASRIEVVTITDVIVHNNPQGKKGKAT